MKDGDGYRYADNHRDSIKTQRQLPRALQTERDGHSLHAYALPET